MALYKTEFPLLLHVIYIFYNSAKDAEIQKEREELETFKRTLERQLRETEGDLDTQRRELMAGFDDNMRKREHENRVQIDELRNSVKAHEIKVTVGINSVMPRFIVSYGTTIP